jgi:chromate transporter
MKDLKDVACVFLKLGSVAFGGPAAHIAMMEDEIVSRRKWMSREHFLDLLGATNLIPGPNSTEMAIHCGFHRAGWAGLIVAGLCFVLPAVFLTGIFAFVYVAYGSLPQIEPFFYGIRPAVLAVIAQAVFKLGGKALKNRQLGTVGAVVAAAVLLGVNEITAILTGGIIGMLWLKAGSKTKINFTMLGVMPVFQKLGIGSMPLLSGRDTMAAAGEIAIGKIFLVFLKIGMVLFGSGYVLVAYLEGEVVQKLGWLTQPQLLDAVAIGQFTPGPVLSTATFIGYQIYGIPGAVAATAGIFLPSFILVAAVNPLIPKLRRSEWTSCFLDAVNISAVGVMAAVTVELAVSSLTDWTTAVIAGGGILAVFVFKKANALWIVLGGALAGFLLKTVFS